MKRVFSRRPSALELLDAVAMLLLLAFLVLGASGARRWLEARSDRQTREVMASATSAIGRRIDVSVVSDLDGSVKPLSDIGTGKCRYVILGSRTCPHTLKAAYRWMLTAQVDSSGGAMPEGWEARWVVLDETSGRGDLFDTTFPSPTFFARNRLDLFRESGVLYMPMHLLLDRQGFVIAAGLERRLLPSAAFLPDCTLDPTIVPAAANEVTPVRPGHL
jgi:hypothetical protein